MALVYNNLIVDTQTRIMAITFNYCPRCATPLSDYTEGHQTRKRCESCGYIYYRNPVPAAGGVICRDLAVCLVKRAFEPKAGQWCLPAGFMEYDETPSACAQREVEEETGLKVTTDGVLGVYSGFDDPRQHAVLIVYWMREDSIREPAAGDDAQDVAFFRQSEIPDDIAFRAHREALRDAFAKLNE